MAETVKEKVEIAEATTEIEAVSEDTVEMVEVPKPYEFRKLSSTDIFLMSRIISKIGINKLVKSVGADDIFSLIKSLSADAKKSEKGAFFVAAAAISDVANTLLSNIGYCEKEIYQLLAQTSNLTVEEITAEGNAILFVEMLIDFLKKDEFPAFFKAVSKLKL